MSILCQTLLLFYEYTTHTHIKSTMFKDNFFCPEKINVILPIPLFNICWRLPSSRKYWVYIASRVPTEAIRREHPAETFPPLSQRNVHVYKPNIHIYVSDIRIYVYIVSGAPTEAISKAHPVETFPPLSQRNAHVYKPNIYMRHTYIYVYIVSKAPTEAMSKAHPAETFPPLSQRNLHMSWNWAGINNSKRKGNLKVSDIWNWHVSFTMETWSYVKRVVERGNVPLDRDFSEFHCADIPRERKGENNVYFHLTSPNEGPILPVKVCSSSFHGALSSPKSKST